MFECTQERESQSLYLKTLVRINKNVFNKDFRGFSLFEEKFEDNRFLKFLTD